MTMSYQDAIRITLNVTGHVGVDARFVEAHMRAERNGVLDDLSPRAFSALALECVDYVAGMSEQDNEFLAHSYGLMVQS